MSSSIGETFCLIDSFYGVAYILTYKRPHPGGTVCMDAVTTMRKSKQNTVFMECNVPGVFPHVLQALPVISPLYWTWALYFPFTNWKSKLGGIICLQSKIWLVEAIDGAR